MPDKSLYGLKQWHEKQTGCACEIHSEIVKYMC